jgi:hypothetical protein
MNKEKLDVWGLIQNGYFDEACIKADAEFAQTGNILLLRNKIYALFHLRKYEESILLSEQLIKLRGGETDVDFIFCGIANWVLGKKKEAVCLWQRGEQSLYKDAAGGVDLQVILYFASVNLQDVNLKKEINKRIKKLLRSKKSVNWPGPLGHYLLGEMEEDAMFSYVSAIPILKERQLCQTYFVISIKELEKGDLEGYKKKLQQSVSYGPPSYLEQIYYLAKGELETM